MMQQGVIQQGTPQCANINCINKQANNGDGSCWYCPSGASNSAHPQGLFYCNQCAIAVSQSGVIQQPASNEPQYEMPPPDDFETKQVSFAIALKWLIYKNFKQQCLRRPCAMACKLICPAVCIVILGLLRFLIPTNEGYIDWAIEINSNSNTIEGESTDWIQNAICANELIFTNGTFDTVPAARYLAIIPPPSSNRHIQGLLDIMSANWAYNFDDTQTQCILDNLPSEICFGENATDSGGYQHCNTTWNDCTCSSWAQYLPFREGWLLRYFASDSDFNKFITSESYGIKYYSPHPSSDIDLDKPIGSAISFEVNEDGSKWSYKIRGNISEMLYVPETSGDVIDKFSRVSVQDLMWKGPSRYINGGFLNMQIFIEKSISKYIASLHNIVLDDIDYIARDYGAFPSKVPATDDFWSSLSGLYIFFSLCQFVYPFSQVVSQLIHEKSDKIKEGMKMMGVTVATYWVSWYIWLFIEATIIALLCWIVSVIFNVYAWSDKLIIFLWLELFCINIACFGTLFSSFFDNPKIATLSAFIVFIVLMFGRTFAESLSESGKNALCLLGPCCFSLSTSPLEQYESALLGLQWDNIYDTYDNFKFNTALVMLFLDSILYIILTLYFDRVWPSRYGQRLHPLFFISPSFWCPNKDKLSSNNNSLSQELIRQKSDTKYEPLDATKYDDSNVSIRIRGLKKYFSSLFDFNKASQTVKAVDGISLDMYKGEVFCLLGHNGAGKTTTIGMLTGLLTVTEGNAWIDGCSIVSNMSEIRKNLGVCPQHDVLFRRLTAEEHLMLFARLKGVPEQYIKNEVLRTLISVGIMDKRNSFPDQMSGGQKRKLSLGIALIGGSKIVFLDEPTSGMDPQSRRVTWNMIAKEKEKRCIILTTHFMDEADILGDRIAVMSDGQVKCCGSSLFLKRIYGVGYTFVVSLNIDVNDSRAIKKEIDNIILNKVIGSECIANAGAEITYRLPFEQTESFPAIFDILDLKKEEFNIKTYGISITTLEEVFLKIGQMEANKTNALTAMINNNNNDNKDNKEEEEKYIDIPDEEIDDISIRFPQPTFQLETQSEFFILFRHIFAILYQRLKLSYRDIRSLCCQILLPAIFTLIGLWILQAVTSPDENPSLLMTSDQWYSNSQSYIIPISKANNTNEININNPILSDNLLNIWSNDDYLQMNFGNLKEFEFNDIQTDYDLRCDWIYDDFGDSECILIKHNENTNDSRSSSNSSLSFGKVLLNNRNGENGNGILHYNAFYIPSRLSKYEYQRPTIYAMFNASAFHSVPITFNALNNWILKYRLNGITEPEIKLYSWPLPITTTEKQFSGAFGGLMVALFLMIALAFLPIGAIYNIVNDKSNLTKHQQLVSGVSCSAYWIANYLSDFIISLPTLLLIWILVHAFDADTFLGDQQGAFIATLILFSLAVIPFTYLLSFLFSSADKAQVIVGTAYIILGILLLMADFIVGMAVPDDKLSANDKKILSDTYRIFPTFLMADSLFQLAFRAVIRTSSVYKWDITGKDLTYMGIEAAGYFILVIVIEYALLYKTIISKWWNKNNQLVNEYVNNINYDQSDIDVIQEMNRIKDINMNDENQEDKVIINGLHKIYKSNQCKSGSEAVHAVQGVHLGVKRGEVFGYLGVNGAGKTTTLACLTGERAITFGNAYVNNISISHQTSVRRFIGYCPQFDALFPLLTGQEHLSFYGRIKGLYGNELDKQVKMLLDVLSLTKYANRRAGTYSGGNKRKLSVAISMIGNPPIVFLDEPSTGMDPMARRSMWEFIRETMNGRCVILTTHSMEECEALCHRLCIMTDGQLRCLGTPQHLKSKFGNGYQLDLTLKNKNDKDIIQNELVKLFNLQLVEHNETKITYEVTMRNKNQNMTLGQIFTTLEEYKKSLPIESYALNQTTLEQIFIKMAKQSYE